MKITRVKLINWKNFSSTDVSLSDRVFVVGPNASGKSNFLDVFRFLHEIVSQGGLESAVSGRGGLEKIRCLAARRDPKVTIEVELETYDKSESKIIWKYFLRLRQESRGKRRVLVDSEMVFKDGKKLLNRPDVDDRADLERLKQTYLEQVSRNKEFREIADFFSEISYYHLVPQLVKFSSAFSGPGIPEDPFGKNFLQKIAKTPTKTRDARLKKISGALKVALPQLIELAYIPPDETGAAHLSAKYSHWRGKGVKQVEKQFSDGTLRLISLFWSLLESDSLLLLEEPELSLHSSIVQQLAAIIFRLQRSRNRQVFVSTHSHDLLSDKGVGLDEILLLIPDKEETLLKQASTISEINKLLVHSFSPAELIFPRTKPMNVNQLVFNFD